VASSGEGKTMLERSASSGIYYNKHARLLRMWQKIKSRPKLTAFLALLIMTVSALGTIYYFSQQITNQADLDVDIQNPDNVLGAGLIEASVGEMPDDVNDLTVLLLGYGGPGHEGGYLADVIQLVRVDFDTKQVALISIPRDLFVKLPSGRQAKINTALTLGSDSKNKLASGGQIAKQMASVVTGLEVDYFIAMDFVGFKRAIGIELQGIEVNVGETLDDKWYPIAGEEQNPCGKSPQEIAALTTSYSGFTLERQFPCRYEHIFFKPGKTRMEGGDVLAYVRSRHGSAGGDFSRSRRQHEVLAGVRDKVLSLDGVKTLPSLFKQLAKHSTTDISLEIVEYLVPALKTAGAFETKSIVISTENVLSSGKSNSGQFILMPKAGSDRWEGTHQFVKNEIEK
jgi:polyisoprenyl-teichoic acid--peptidoglycan teichoic acid transferase